MRETFTIVTTQLDIYRSVRSTMCTNYHLVPRGHSNQLQKYTYHMLSVAWKGQNSTSRPRLPENHFLTYCLDHFEDMLLMPFGRGSHFPLNGLQPCFWCLL